MPRSIGPIATTDWLQTQLPLSTGGDLTIIDVRWSEEYEAGHIPGAISVPFSIQSVWSESGGDYLLELPPDEELFKLIGNCGLARDSRVIVVGRIEEPPAPQYALADPVRVAATLMYAGVRNVAVLSGGHPAWERDKGEITTDVPSVTPRAYNAATDKDTWVSTDYVKAHIGTAVLVDGRDPDQYFGSSTDPFADMRGHIPTARCLPVVWVWDSDGKYQPAERIADMVVGVLGEKRNQEIIAYCGVGGYASVWWFLLTQLLGYTNVKIYDGSMEAWVDGGNPLVKYTWTE
jgi:thiosulfate/3-mercaptopyruvate sulfurtransferase